VKLILAVLIVLVFMTPAPSPALDPGSAKIRITASITSTTIKAGHVVTSERLYNKSIREKPIGFAIRSCLLVQPNTKMCDVVYSLPHGRIDAHGLISNEKVYTLAVTGGTGTYQNSGGQVDVIATEEHTLQLTFSLRAF
jgi:hypothetical protein